MKPRPKLRTFCRWMLTILVVALVVVWIGSRRYDLIFAPYWFSGGYRYSMSTEISFAKCYFSIGRLYGGSDGSAGIDWDFGRYMLFGRHLAINYARGVEPIFGMTFPLWLTPLLVAIPAALMWRTYIINRRRKPGMCIKCGYDISGLVGQEACPECGTKFPAEISKASI